MAVTTASSGASNSLPSKITVTVAHALQHSLMTFVSTLLADNHAPLVSSAAPFPPSVLSVVSSSAMVAASSLASTSGTLRVPPFVSMFTTIFTINGSCSDGLAQSITAPIMASHVSSLFLGSNSLASLCDKAFVVGPGHAPFPVKLVKNYWRQLCRVSRLIVGKSQCCRPGAPFISG